MNNSGIHDIGVNDKSNKLILPTLYSLADEDLIIRPANKIAVSAIFQNEEYYLYKIEGIYISRKKFNHWINVFQFKEFLPRLSSLSLDKDLSLIKDKRDIVGLANNSNSKLFEGTYVSLTAARTLAKKYHLYTRLAPVLNWDTVAKVKYNGDEFYEMFVNINKFRHIRILRSCELNKIKKSDIYRLAFFNHYYRKNQNDEKSNYSNEELVEIEKNSEILLHKALTFGNWDDLKEVEVFAERLHVLKYVSAILDSNLSVSRCWNNTSHIDKAGSFFDLVSETQLRENFQLLSFGYCDYYSLPYSFRIEHINPNPGKKYVLLKDVISEFKVSPFPSCASKKVRQKQIKVIRRNSDDFILADTFIEYLTAMKLYEKCYKISQNRDKPYNEEQQEKLMHFSILNILKLRDYIQLLDGLEYCLTEIYPQIHGYWIPLDEARKMFEKMDYNADIVTTEEAFDKFLKLGKFSNSKEISLNVDIVSPPLQNSNDKKKGTVLSRDLKDVETSKVNGIGASIIALNPITLVERHEWSKDELIVLFESIEKYGLNYEKISDIFKSNNHRRSPSALRSFIESPDNESFPELKMLFGNANSTYNSKDWFASVKKLISSLFKIDSETGDESNRMNYSRRASLQEIKKQALTLRSNSSNRSLFPHWAETAASADENCNSKSERKTSGFKRSTSLKRSDHFWVTIDLKKTSFKFNGTNNDNSNLLVQDAQEISDKLVISETQAQAPTQSSISIDSIENLAAVLKKASAENLTTLKNFEEMCERIYLNCADDKVKQVMEDEVFKFWRPVFKKIKYQADSGFSNKNKQELKENKKLKKKQKHKEKKRKKQKNKSLYKRLKLNDIGNTQKIVIELISKSNDTSFEVMNISERLDGNSSKSNGDSDYNSTN